MNIKPLGERVLVKPIKAEEKTSSGIYIPVEAKQEKKQAIVQEVGKSKDGKEFPLKKGDMILYGGYSSEEFEINNETFLIIDIKDVVGIITE